MEKGNYSSVIFTTDVINAPSFCPVDRVFRRMRLIRGRGVTVIADLALADKVFFMSDALLLVATFQVGAGEFAVHFGMTNSFAAGRRRRHCSSGGQVELSGLETDLCSDTVQKATTKKPECYKERHLVP